MKSTSPVRKAARPASVPNVEVPLEVQTPQTPQQVMTAMVEELIRERAHQLYLQRGCIDGYAAADWFEAERQILSELNHAVA